MTIMAAISQNCKIDYCNYYNDYCDFDNHIERFILTESIIF